MLSLFWGFRLTIWNVNITKYYHIFNTYICFRLTIWNVNKEGGEQYAWVKWRFRLTIWNVNCCDFTNKTINNCVLD
ncbi:hypothetical protein [Clostridioides difficile]|uniref:hypothetical protein n=1 Tax=Clostridioides difficile TaxID=1496 RepID=UPI00265BFC36|nr:hypothetical protein [Clostridioides difficile]MDV5872289.1 hypothetical protein [Clostridioides difficile]